MPPFFLVKQHKKLTQANGRMIARRALKGSSLKLESINKPNYLHMRICAVNSPSPEKKPARGPNSDSSKEKEKKRIQVTFVFSDICLCHHDRLHVCMVTFKSRGSKSQGSDSLHLFHPSCFRVNTKRSPPLGCRQSGLAEALAKQSTVRLPSTQIRA